MIINTTVKVAISKREMSSRTSFVFIAMGYTGGSAK